MFCCQWSLQAFSLTIMQKIHTSQCNFVYLRNHTISNPIMYHSKLKIMWLQATAFVWPSESFSIWSLHHISTILNKPEICSIIPTRHKHTTILDQSMDCSLDLHYIDSICLGPPYKLLQSLVIMPQKSASYNMIDLKSKEEASISPTWSPKQGVPPPDTQSPSHVVAQHPWCVVHTHYP